MKKELMARVLLDLDDVSAALTGLGHPLGHPLTTALRKVNLAIRAIRDQHEDMETLIRQCSAKGMTKTQAQTTLRISNYRFRLLTDAMPDLVWPTGHELAVKRNECRRGRPATPQQKSGLDKGRKIMVDNARKYSICGVRGTLRELCDLWCDYMVVSYSTVGSRLRKGWSLYDAMFKPRQPSAVSGTNASREHRAKLSRYYSSTFSHRQRIKNSKQQEARP